MTFLKKEVHFKSNYSFFPLRRIENGRVSGRRLQRLPGTRVEPASNSEYAPISELRLITHDYGIQSQTVRTYLPQSINKSDLYFGSSSIHACH